MAVNSTTRRRWFGALALLGALGMLLSGETVFRGRLSKLEFVAYWLVCIGFTGLAMVAAFLDLRALQRRIRQEQRELIERTLKEIETEARTKPPPLGQGPHGGTYSVQLQMDRGEHGSAGDRTGNR